MKARRAIFIVFITALLILGACIPITGGPRANSDQLLSTLVMQTVSARQTQEVFETLVAQLTAVPSLQPGEQPTEVTPAPTETPVVPTFQPILPTPTPFLPTPAPTATPVPCYQAQFVEDISVPDGTTFAAGESFVKTWRLKNVGSCTWGEDTAVVFSTGDGMNGPSSQRLGVSVQPGQTVDVSIRLAAPANPGQYSGYWSLRSTNGLLFGIGINAQTDFWVKINVTQAPASEPNLLYDFAAYYCTAEWRSNSGSVACPTNSADASKGLVGRSYKPAFEGGYVDNQAAILMQPGAGDGGVITGKFPAFKVKNGMDFSAVIGCQDKSPKCDVTFQLNYIADGGPVQTLATWTQKSEGNLENIRLDLNTLDGKSVQFILAVYNNGDSTDDRVFWLVPAIR